MKKIKYFALFIIFFGLMGCNTTKYEITEEYVEGTQVFLGALQKHIKKYDLNTKSLEEAPEPCMSEMVALSRDYLEVNDIDLSEYFEEEDPRLAIVAMLIAEIDSTSQIQQEDGPSFHDITTCLVEAVGLGAIFEAIEGKLTKQVAIAIAKKTAKKLAVKAIPYIGWGIAAYDFIDCLSEHF